LRTDFKFCTVVWYHKIQIKFEFQCDQIIGAKVVTVWRLKICDFSWYRGNSRKGGPRIECYPFPEIFTSFRFPPNRAISPFYPSVRSSSPTYFTSTFIYNSADGLVYPSTLSGEILCDALRLVWCVCVRPSLCPPPMVSRYNLRTDFKLCTVVWYHKIQILGRTD
jgi:hypothetical protein